MREQCRIAPKRSCGPVALLGALGRTARRSLCRCCARFGLRQGRIYGRMRRRAPRCVVRGARRRWRMRDARGRTRHCARRVERRVRAARRLRFVGNVWRGRTFRDAAEFPHAVPEKEEGALPAHAFRAAYVVSSAAGAGRIRSVAHRQHAAARFLAHPARDRGL